VDIGPGPQRRKSRIRRRHRDEDDLSIPASENVVLDLGHTTNTTFSTRPGRDRTGSSNRAAGDAGAE
jgi:hypothetical protein